MQPLQDTFGRVHKDLRISVTDRCNFRCQYCMPEEGMTWLDKSDVLDFDEIFRVAKILVKKFGLESIRLTGGEPTLRKQLDVLIKQLATLDVELSMTTNGTTLVRQAEGLRKAGLKRLNVSIDSLDRSKFADLTKQDRLNDVLAGIDAAVDAGFDPVKINVMLMKGINDDEILDFLEFGLERGVTVRFIEFMPLDAGEGWSNDDVVSAQDILAAASTKYEFTRPPRGSSPAELFTYWPKDAPGPELGTNAQVGDFGIIASVTEPFCGDCDRTRLTSDGQFRNCLFALGHLDLRGMLRSEATDDEIASAMQGEVLRKRSGHAIGDVYFVRPTKSMSQVGG